MIENTHPKIKWTVMINLGELPPFLFLHSLVIRWRPSVEMRTALKNQLSRAAAISTAFSSFNLSGDRSILFSRFVSSFLSFVGSCSPFFAGSLGTLALIFAFIICLFVCLMNWLDRVCFNCDYHLFFFDFSSFCGGNSLLAMIFLGFIVWFLWMGVILYDVYFFLIWHAVWRFGTIGWESGSCGNS